MGSSSKAATPCSFGRYNVNWDFLSLLVCISALHLHVWCHFHNFGMAFPWPLAWLSLVLGSPTDTALTAPWTLAPPCHYLPPSLSGFSTFLFIAPTSSVTPQDSQECVESLCNPILTFLLTFPWWMWWIGGPSPSALAWENHKLPVDHTSHPFAYQPVNSSAKSLAQEIRKDCSSNCTLNWHSQPGWVWSYFKACSLSSLSNPDILMITELTETVWLLNSSNDLSLLSQLWLTLFQGHHLILPRSFRILFSQQLLKSSWHCLLLLTDVSSLSFSLFPLHTPATMAVFCQSKVSTE